VYEAEHVEQGRRVALKLLSDRPTDPEDRARFLREGQLAASITHPNCVYIFGSEEIAGTLVITMELLSGGTLKDRVRDRGPLPPAEAVDAILHVIAGLDAAHACGILHRDIKPANCFIDSDGTVKVGDFGLSISTLARDATRLTRTGMILGTPHFAAPEQLRGHPLDVRSDIYAVGATLYYLLTAEPPFDDTDMMTLLTHVATEVPRSPRDVVHAVPRGLAAIVLRCLAKDRASRPATYAELNEALRPFGSTPPTAANLGSRVAACAIDQILLFVVVSVSLVPRASLSLFMPAYFALMAAYFTLTEGLIGASVGKWIFELRVTDVDGGRPGVVRARITHLQRRGWPQHTVVCLGPRSGPVWAVRVAFVRRLMNQMEVSMAERLEFEVHGPFEIPLHERTRDLAPDGFWRRGDGELQRLSECCGCYVLALEKVKGELMPCYVGLTKRTFREEVFNRSNLLKYGAALAPNKRHGLMMFLITPPDSSKMSKSYIGALESFLIQAASAQNPDLQNWKGVDRPKWLIRGVTGRTPVKPTMASRKFRAAMGIE
jgi:hypothetical protein